MNPLFWAGIAVLAATQDRMVNLQVTQLIVYLSWECMFLLMYNKVYLEQENLLVEITTYIGITTTTQLL